jgi:hypothetical protein
MFRLIPGKIYEATCNYMLFDLGESRTSGPCILRGELFLALEETAG